MDDIGKNLGRLRKHGAQIVAEVVSYEDPYLLRYIRGPEGFLIEHAEELN